MPSSNKLNLAITVNGQEVETTLTNLNKSFYKLRNSVNKLEEGTDEWIAANRELAKVEKARERQIKVQREYREEISKTIDAQEDSVRVLGEFGENASIAYESLRNGDMVAFQANWKKVTENIKYAGKALVSFIATPIGAFLAVLGTIAAVTSKFVNYNKEISESVKLTQQLTGFDGQELSQFRAAVQATAETFDKEFNEVLKSANSLSKQMGITQQEALELINQGLVRGADLNGDFLKKLEEYPVQFKNAGYSAQDFIDIATQEAKGGIYDDKLIDAIKEADLALKEMTKTQQDALENAFGAKFANEIAKGVASGRLTTEDAINKIIAKSNELGLNLQQKQQLVADVFKGAGEDAGGFAVIIEQINAAFDKENKKLNENEKATMRLVDANTEYEQALADVFDASQSGFPAMLTNIKSIWQEIKTGVLVQLKNMFTSIEKLKQQAANEGQSEAIKRIYENVTLFGGTAAQAAQEQMGATEKTIERLKKKIEDFPWYGIGKVELQKQLAAQESYLNELTEIAKGKSQEYTDYVNSIGNPTDTGNGDGGQTEDEKKAAEERAKKALEEKKKQLEAIQKLQEEYDAITTKRVEEKAEDIARREKAEALAEAERLKASHELIEQITAEHDLRIQEAKAEDREKELQDIADFEARKQALLDEIELAKAETDAEKEKITEEQEIEKQEIANEKEKEAFEAELDKLKIHGEERANLLALLEEAQQLRLAKIRDKWRKKDEKSREEELKAKQELLKTELDNTISVVGQQSDLAKGLLLIKKAILLQELAMKAKALIQEITMAQAKASVNIAEGATKTASAGAPQNIPLLILYAIQAAGLIASMVSATSKAKSVKKASFARGGFTDGFGQGYMDETGHEVAGVVHKNEYVVPAFLRKDPEVPVILDYLETKRKRGLGLYAEGGNVSKSTDNTNASSNAPLFLSSTDPELKDLLRNLNETLLNGIEAKTYYGPEAEVKRQEVQKKVDKIKSNSTIKKA